MACEHHYEMSVTRPSVLQTWLAMSCVEQCMECLCEDLFFFSSRRRHTRFSRDWSSDVCSSDLGGYGIGSPQQGQSELAAVGRLVDKLAHLSFSQRFALERQRKTPQLLAVESPGLLTDEKDADAEIGRASCRERVWSAVVVG